MMYTDGLIEGRVEPGSTQRLGAEGMLEMVNRQLAAGLSGDELLEAAVTQVRELNGGELTDDVAVLLLARGPDLAPRAESREPAQLRGNARG
jgi:serine phosphatase RsbU (regulator of sigma subunit)